MNTNFINEFIKNNIYKYELNFNKKKIDHIINDPQKIKYFICMNDCLYYNYKIYINLYSYNLIALSREYFCNLFIISNPVFKSFLFNQLSIQKKNDILIEKKLITDECITNACMYNDSFTYNMLLNKTNLSFQKHHLETAIEYENVELSNHLKKIYINL